MDMNDVLDISIFTKIEYIFVKQYEPTKTKSSSDL
jgi:hypothetical protein